MKMNTPAETAGAGVAAAGLTDRTMGWLRFVWDKATTPDDWSDSGEPHPWWDRYTAAPMCSFPRFDLHYMAYILPPMMEATPAWREVKPGAVQRALRRITRQANALGLTVRFEPIEAA
jgi:hypothetical protein